MGNLSWVLIGKRYLVVWWEWVRVFSEGGLFRIVFEVVFGRVGDGKEVIMVGVEWVEGKLCDIIDVKLYGILFRYKLKGFSIW